MKIVNCPSKKSEQSGSLEGNRKSEQPGFCPRLALFWSLG